MRLLQPLLVLALLIHCHGQTLVQQMCSADRRMTEIETGANVVLGGLFEIRGHGQNGYGCGAPVTDTMQIFEAARFALNTLNSGSGLVSGVTFGMRAYDTCYSDINALSALQKLYPQTTSRNPFCSSGSQVIAGAVGTLDSGTSTAAAGFAGQIPMSLVSPRAMGPQLSDKLQFPTFLRTVPSNTVYAKAVVELLHELNWSRVVVVYTNTNYGRGGYEELLKAAFSRGICVTQALELDPADSHDDFKAALTTISTNSFTPAVLISADPNTKRILRAADEVPGVSNFQWILKDLDTTHDVSNLIRARGAIIMEPTSPLIDEFAQYFSGLEANPSNNVGNPWFQEWYETTYGCSLTGGGTACPTLTQAQARNRFKQSPWVLPTIKAVFAYAMTVQSICQGSGGGACQTLRNMSPTDFHNRLRNLDYTFPSTFSIASLRGQKIKFNANGDPEVSEFTIFNYNNTGVGNFAFDMIGNFGPSGLTLNRPPVLYDSARNSLLTTLPTSPCPATGCENCIQPTRSVTFRYMSGDVVIASLVNAHYSGRAPFSCGDGIESRLAALVAVEWAVSRYQPQQVSVGCLVADICPDSSIARGFLTDALSGNNRLVDTRGAVIQRNNIYAFVDQTESGQAESISPILSKYMIPEVQAGATTPALMNDEMTPYFTRAIPNDNVYYTAVASLLQRLGWRYVQVATHSSGRHHSMAQNFVRIAAKYGICVVSKTGYFDSEDSSRYDMTLDHLLSKTNAEVVVVIGDMEDVRGLLTAINTRGVAGQLQLVAGSDRWSRNPDYIQGLESAAAGAIVLDYEMGPNTEFNTYLTGLTRDQILAHPFLRELFEISNQCSLDPSTLGLYARICDTSDTFSVYQGTTPYVIESVRNVISKLQEVISDKCGGPAICANFVAATDVGELLDQKLQNIGRSTNGFGIMNGEGITNYNFYVYNNNFVQFGSFNTQNRQLVSVTQTQVSPQSKESSCSSVCMECQYMFNLQSGLYNMGDWIIAGAFGVHNPGPVTLQPYICGDVRQANGPQYTMAMLYALHRVNSGAADVGVRGVKFGGLALDHCGNPGRTNLMVGDIYSGFMNDMGIDQSRILAWLTDSTQSTNEAAELLNPLGIAMVSPSATSANLLEYPTFYRTIQGDATIASALVKVVKSLGFMYIQAVYSDSDYGRDGVETMAAVAQGEGVCIINRIELTNDTASVVAQLLASQTDIVVLFTGTSDTDRILKAIASDATARTKLLILLPMPSRAAVRNSESQLTNRIISLELQKSTLTDYHAYINSNDVSNPYFAMYYMSVMNCNLPGYSMYPQACTTPLASLTTNNNYIEDSYVLSTINAVYAVVDALDRTVQEYCPTDYSYPCAAFMSAPDKRSRFNANLNSVIFRDETGTNFRFVDREGNTAYNIIQSDGSGSYKSSPIGDYAGVSLNLYNNALTPYPNVQSVCLAPCEACIMNGITFSHIPGDVYIAGMFDVHARYLSPFTCGQIQTLHGFLLLEAFHYAIEQVNSKQGQFRDILKGTRLGGIGLDACGSQVRGGYLVSNIHSGFTSLAKDGVVIAPSMIDAYIGSYGSKPSIYLARILNDLEIPQISYAAGSDDLSDTRHYPFFYRTVPTDGHQVEALLTFLDELDIRYVQIVFEDNSNGISAKDDFVRRAADFRICVAETISHPDIGVATSEVANIIYDLVMENSAANAVVTFLGTKYINALLKVAADKDRGSANRNITKFVGSLSWSDNLEAITGAENRARGSVTLSLDTPDLAAFEVYINQKTLDNSLENPWFPEYFQRIFNCYLSKDNTMGFTRACDSNQGDLINAIEYQQDPGVIYVINAVYAAAFGIHETLKDLCGDGYTSVCQAYRNNLDRRLTLRDNLDGVTFTDPVGNPFKFYNRSAIYNFTLNAIDQGTLNTISYQQIGTYDAMSREANVVTSYNRATWNSDCDRQDACAECPAIRDDKIRYVFRDSSPQGSNDLTIVAFFDIHKQGVDRYRCGEINPVGFQQFLSFFYTIENVLTVRSKRFKLLAIDTCSNSLRVDQDLFGLLQGSGLCNSLFDDSMEVALKNLGTVITLGEDNTMAASRVLELPGVTYISPNALSTMLDDKEHLVRTIAPTSAMMKALVSLLKALGWTYVDVVYADTAEGIYPYDKFSYFADEQRICRGSSILVGSVGSTDLQTLLGQLSGPKGSKAVILLGSQDHVRRVLAAAKTLGIVGRYVWILAVDWEVTKDALLAISPEDVTVRYIVVTRFTDTVASFDTYVNALTYEKLHDPNQALSIPLEWYDEFFEAQHNCKLTPMVSTDVPCNTSKTFSSSQYMQNKHIINTIAATLAAVEGLCGATDPTSSCQDRGDLDSAAARESVRKSILEVTWNMLTNRGDFQLAHKAQITEMILEFDQMYRWWDSGYVIRQFRVRNPDPVPDGDVLYQGVFDDDKPRQSEITSMQNALKLESVCNEAEEGCGCSFNTYVAPEPLTDDKFRPEEPRNYYKYEDDGVKKQYEWPIWAIAVAVLTSIGLVVAIILFLVLLFAYPRRGGTSVLGYMVIIGIIGIYAINFAFFVHAYEVTCGIRRFLMGVIYMITFAPLLIKAVDNWRFGHVDYADDRYKGISSAAALFFMAVGVVLVQCIIPIMWLILVHPTASEVPYNGFYRHDITWCDPPDEYDVGLVLSFVFVMFIILLTSVFSALAYDTERNNYESRWILLGCIITAGCFLVWMIVSTNAGPPYRDPAVAIANFVNATLLLLVLPIRKTVLMCRHRQEKEEKEDAMEVMNGGTDMYGNAYNNPTFDIGDFDNTFVESKPSDL